MDFRELKIKDNIFKQKIELENIHKVNIETQIKLRRIVRKLILRNEW